MTRQVSRIGGPHRLQMPSSADTCPSSSPTYDRRQGAHMLCRYRRSQAYQLSHRRMSPINLNPIPRDYFIVFS